MNCTNCGKENPEQAIFCIQCGKQVQATGKLEPSHPIRSTPMTAEVALHASPIETWHTAISSSAKWIRRIAIPLVTLAWIALAAVILWAASHIGRGPLLLALAALLAVSLSPSVNIATRVVPRLLRIPA